MAHWPRKRGTANDGNIRSKRSDKVTMREPYLTKRRVAAYLESLTDGLTDCEWFDVQVGPTALPLEEPAVDEEALLRDVVGGAGVEDLYNALTAGTPPTVPALGMHASDLHAEGAAPSTKTVRFSLDESIKVPYFPTETIAQLEARLRETYDGVTLVQSSSGRALDGNQLVSTVGDLWLKARGQGGIRTGASEFAPPQQPSSGDASLTILVTVEGLIGSGKTTVLEQLQQACFANDPRVEVRLERVREWESDGLLQAANDGALPEFQYVTLSAGVGQIVEAHRKPGVRLILSERGPRSNREVFAAVHVTDPVKHRACA